jgi:hypothetical protein
MEEVTQPAEEVKQSKPKEDKSNHYVSNEQLYNAIIEFKQKVRQAEEQGLKKPVIPHYIGECLLKIANKLSYSPNFINYTFRDEMIADGLENCVNYFHNFDPTKSTNPFSYFTQIIYYAFLRRIQKEKKYMYVKHKATQQKMISRELIDVQELDELSEYDIEIADYTSSEYMNNFIQQFEADVKRKKLDRRTKKGLENVIKD